MIKLFSTALLLALVAAFDGQAEVRQPSEDEVQKMTAAMPGKARVKSGKPRKILVIGQNESHAPVPYAAKALQIMGQKTGAFKAIISNDGSHLEPEKLLEFDAVVINNWHGWDPFLGIPRLGFEKLSAPEKEQFKKREARRKQALLRFVAGGKGLVGIHAAAVGLDDWKEYSEMIGGKYAALPWTEATIKIEDRQHPLCAAFNGKSFRIADEIYELKEPYSRDLVRVLLSVDTTQTTQPKSSKYGKPVRTDDDYGLSWVKSYGKGRVFYSALGHSSATYWNPVMLQHFLDGIQFAVGDLPADTTPTAKLKR